MRIEKCQWKYGKQAPVMFMIDDFANKYMTDQMDGNYVGADWGGRCKAPNSLYEFLQEKIFRHFPYIKMTLFLVVGRREAIIEGGKPSISKRIDESTDFADFLRELAHDDRFEVAYHGNTHGKLLPGVGSLTQEWKTFASLEEAYRSIEKGKELYHTVTGEQFFGGKYCGYESNSFSDESIAQTGFEWWCRHYDANLYTHRASGVESLDLDEFNGVVDIPSTVDGGLFSLHDVRNILSRGYLKAAYYFVKYHLTVESILDQLVKDGRVINIQEHSSPMREDNKHQTPNLVDDIRNIQYILRYLKRYDLWYATGHEIAEYWKIYQSTKVLIEGEKFVMTLCNSDLLGKSIWISISEEESKNIRLKSDVGEIIIGKKSGERTIFEIKFDQAKMSFAILRER